MSRRGRRLRPGLRRAGSAADEELRARGLTPHRLRAAASKRGLLDGIADALEFPAWAGRNWDALADALGDLSWLPPGPHALVWVGPDELRAADPEAYAIAVRLLGEAAEASAGTARPLTVLLVPGQP